MAKPQETFFGPEDSYNLMDTEVYALMPFETVEVPFDDGMGFTALNSMAFGLRAPLAAIIGTDVSRTHPASWYVVGEMLGANALEPVDLGKYLEPTVPRYTAALVSPSGLRAGMQAQNFMRRTGEYYTPPELQSAVYAWQALQSGVIEKMGRGYPKGSGANAFRYPETVSGHTFSATITPKQGSPWLKVRNQDPRNGLQVRAKVIHRDTEPPIRIAYASGARANRQP